MRLLNDANQTLSRGVRKSSRGEAGTDLLADEAKAKREAEAKREADAKAQAAREAQQAEGQALPQVIQDFTCFSQVPEVKTLFEALEAHAAAASKQSA